MLNHFQCSCYCVGILVCASCIVHEDVDSFDPRMYLSAYGYVVSNVGQCVVSVLGTNTLIKQVDQCQICCVIDYSEYVVAQLLHVVSTSRLR